MVLEDSSSEERTQRVRRVYEHTPLNPNTSASLSEVFLLECNYDDVSGKDIILWDDILAAFKDVVHIRAGAKILPFLKGHNFKILDPLRIAAVPGVILDVVVTGQLVRSESTSSQEAQTKTPLKEISLESLQNSIPNTSQELSSANSFTTASSTIPRNPAYGLVEEALQNYNHIDIPPTAPDGRGPQAIPDNQSSANHNDEHSKAQHSLNKTQQNTRAPQEQTSGIARDFPEALMVAALGDKDAQYNIGVSYQYGEGVPQDYGKAMEWYRKAADQGHAKAQCNVGLLYQQGVGVPQDNGRAMEWYRKAADQGHAYTQYYIGVLYQHGVGVPQDYGRAMEWYRKAVDQGNADAQCNMGYLYDFGLGVPQDDVEAVHFYRKAAEQGHSISQVNLGNMYYNGRGTPKDETKAMEWYKKAADQGILVASEKIAQLEQQGISLYA